eukprot:NODE_1864_length_824_cov_90.787097_g1469_i0.p1 GENE.NODE_1864_length_824_cov_90.787097_g1469_i0~~NODE_1864_length_824_cov_90.787097_g1469_i0.p1  ORF type:complete len:227 (-),score=54.53 NODE_1864_length_824_cov_90.787097_g1469_i0:113-793(-)
MGSLVDWVKKNGVYNEKDWPSFGTCKMCGSGIGNCNDTACAMTRLPKTCEGKHLQRAKDNNDPCECVVESLKNVSYLLPYCHANLVAWNYATCSCKRMQEAGIKPMFTGAEISAVATDLLFKTIKNGTDKEPRDAGYARWLFRNGPSIAHINAIGGSWSFNPLNPKRHCTSNAQHEITVVGWNAAAPKPYWTIRNSWSPNFGDHGFVYVAMNCDCPGPTGLCAALN